MSNTVVEMTAASIWWLLKMLLKSELVLRRHNIALVRELNRRNDFAAMINSVLLRLLRLWA